MECPVCKLDLLLSERQGIEIDYCPKCRGVWLDRGELDKIIERSDNISSVSYSHNDHSEHKRDDQYKNKGRKKKSLFGELFDFD